MITGLAASAIMACDPLEDEINQINAGNNEVRDMEITLTEDDYAMSSDEGVAKFNSFSDEEDAKTLIPEILDQKFPALGDGSSAKVTYDFYAPIRINNEEEYTLVEQDYIDLGEDLGTLSSDGDIIDAAELKFSEAEERDVVTLTYQYFTGEEEVEQESKLVFYEGDWIISYVPSKEDYTFMGQSFPNFSSRTEARERIAVVLNDRYRFDDEGAVRTAVFTYTYKNDEDKRVFEDFLAVFVFDGTVWVPQQDTMPATLSFGHDGSTWVADNTIKIELGTPDYEAIAEASKDANADGADNLQQYGSFALERWTNDQIFTAITNWLLDTYPATAEGQKYLVTYATWEPGAGTGELYVILEGGVYKVISE